MQQHKVVSWLSQHNFPHGLVAFADGLSTDPLAHKAAYLKNLVQVILYFIIIPRTKPDKATTLESQVKC